MAGAAAERRRAAQRGHHQGQRQREAGCPGGPAEEAAAERPAQARAQPPRLARPAALDGLLPRPVIARARSLVAVVAHLEQQVERGAAVEPVLELVAQLLLLQLVRLGSQLPADVVLDDARVAQLVDAPPPLQPPPRAGF